MNPIRVVLADDHTLVRAGLRKLLESMGGVEVVAEADDGAEVPALVGAHAPDAVLMDFSMQQVDGVAATCQIKRQYPDTRVIMLSMHSDSDSIALALRAGACGYVLKHAAPTELESALKSVIAGNIYLSATALNSVAGNLRSLSEPDEPHISELSERQCEILRLIAEGKGGKEIAHMLKIGLKTVESHRTQLMKRLDIHNVPGLVRYAIRSGLTSASRKVARLT